MVGGHGGESAAMKIMRYLVMVEMELLYRRLPE
jgi:hypothetical protein